MNDATDLDLADENILTYTPSDEALEAAADKDSGGRHYSWNTFYTGIVSVCC